MIVALPCASVAFRDQKILELPRVGPVELRLVKSAEGVDVVLQRSPVRGHRYELTQVGLADAQHVVMGEIVGHAESTARMLDHPQASSDHGYGHLHGGGVLVRNQAARFLDV